MTTEARDPIEHLDRDGRNFLFGWIANQLDAGRPFTMDSLRDCAENERLTRPREETS